MPRVILQFEDQTLKEYAVGPRLTIGRLPDNTVTIDNGAVSGHHACIVHEGNDFILEDLRSRNGTYVNEKHVYRHRLQNGDVVLVGKHKLVFDQMADGEATAPQAAPTLPNMGDTVYLNTERHRELLAKLRTERWGSQRTSEAGPPSRSGVLHVVAGHADEPQYELEARTTLIGKAEHARVRLHGWFQPQVAAAITRSGDGYVATHSGGRTLINNEPLAGRHNLKHGDVLQVGRLKLEFRTK